MSDVGDASAGIHDRSLSAVFRTLGGTGTPKDITALLDERGNRP